MRLPRCLRGDSATGGRPEFTGIGVQTADCASASDVQTRITIEVTGGEKGVPVENASVYVKFIEEHAIKKDKKLEMNVKTSRDGIAHVPNAPMGRVLVQVVAEGWKTYGRWLDLTDPKQTIKVHLERPPKWY